MTGKRIPFEKIIPPISDDWTPSVHRSDDDPTALSYWFPKIREAGLAVPETRLVGMTDEECFAIWPAFDSAPMGGAAEHFFERLRIAADELGYPCFLRTDYTSGKHEWDRACFVPDRASISDHAFGIMYFSECVSVMGGTDPSWINWAVREFLPTMPIGTCPRYGNMPICREFRFFVDGPEIRCWHPYWPDYALDQGGAILDKKTYARLCSVDNEQRLRDIASAAGKALGGAWSVDLLETERGWYLTDMAEADKSFHWEGCPGA